MRLTFLGTGTSFGVPQVGCACATCRSDDPRDRRTRCAVVIETPGGTRLLVDTPPELRLQLLAAQVRDVDAVLFTHEHADHLHGIDDLRAFTVRRDRPLPLYGDVGTLDAIAARFRYIVDPACRPLPGTSKPEGTPVRITAGVPFRVGDADILPIAVPHGPVTVLGFRVGPLAYVTDAQHLPESAFDALAGVELLVLNALWHRPHPPHLSIADAVAAAQRIGAARTYLTHLTHETPHAALAAELPPGIAPAHDGLVVEWTPPLPSS